ncbi:Gfo/Idh/MocA family oxidoreductase, partial [Coprobacillus cateniformis]
LIEQKTIGEIRLIRANFGFPKRAENDFRYNKKLGGGALLDCGGYPIKLMSLLLGNEMKIDSSRLIYNKNEIDLFGSVQLSNENIIAQISFGMDNAYKCDLEIWGSEGTISINRIFTAPVGFEADIYINTNNSEKIIHVEADDTFMKSILKFKQCIIDKNTRDIEYKELLKQIKLIEDVRGKK